MVKFKKKYIKLTSTFLLLIMISVYCSFFFSQASTSTSGENHKEFDNKAPILSAAPDWYKTFGINATDGGYNVAVDSSNNVYVVGYLDNGTGNQDICLIKYDSSGVQQWNRT